jgi:hypothetical protein
MLAHGHPYDPPHEHPHPPGHEHAHAHSPERPHEPQGGAVLDIGGDVGAVLVHAGPALDGEEIELYDEEGTYVMHTEVHGRDVSGVRRYAGLFPAVLEGTYLLDTCDGSPRQRVVVTGGQVAVMQQKRAEAPASS